MNEQVSKLKYIKDLIKSGEKQTTEFKLSFDKETIETITAFANTKGGTILLGINNNGSIIGTNIGQESIQKYINQTKNSTEPSLFVDIEEILIDDKKILLIKIGEFPIKPVSFKGKYYKRLSNSNHKMTLTEISNMHLQSLQLSWDSYEAIGSSFDTLDIDKIDKFFTKVNKTGRFKLLGTRKENLKKLSLLKNNSITNAAKLLFAKEQNSYNVHIGRFKTPTMILDDKMIRGTLFEVVEETMFYILSHIKVAFEFTGEIQRTEILEYPKEALRELILNSIVHRDYTSPTDIQIKIFDNSIRIFNPGNLYGDITIEQLKTNSYPSRTRNRLIAEAFYLTGDIEKYGSGYLRIRREIETYPTMKFEYEESGNGYMVTLNYTEQKTTLNVGANVGANVGVNVGANVGVNVKIYQFIKQNQPVKIDALIKEFNTVTPRTIERWLKQLKGEGKIEFRGAPKTGAYYAK